LLLVVLWGPFPSTREVIPVIGFAILLAVGIETLRRKTEREFPDAQLGDATHALRAWYLARRHSTATAVSSLRSSVSTGDGSSGGGGGNAQIADLERLASLHDRGVLTDEEFRAQKTALLRPSA
jgi:hypothetical protein